MAKKSNEPKVGAFLIGALDVTLPNGTVIPFDGEEDYQKAGVMIAPTLFGKTKIMQQAMQMLLDVMKENGWDDLEFTFNGKLTLKQDEAEVTNPALDALKSLNGNIVKKTNHLEGMNL